MLEDFLRTEYRIWPRKRKDHPDEEALNHGIVSWKSHPDVYGHARGFRFRGDGATAYCFGSKRKGPSRRGNLGPWNSQLEIPPKIPVSYTLHLYSPLHVISQTSMDTFSKGGGLWSVFGGTEWDTHYLLIQRPRLSHRRGTDRFVDELFLLAKSGSRITCFWKNKSGLYLAPETHITCCLPNFGDPQGPPRRRG
ncbi:hypothetical protein K402DRAFT_76025 [Aulographum hederae CBS 113979]|uniref:Uncharacterized protein n=1 Tax=Aulographum hederae CBS 113979 TaxID=1176131 RepID=A0A6G1HFQ9_9PEZI|nr:hypothetical protein K402DRAFT_76025 [Aulographum hederae CBS 113979]